MVRKGVLMRAHCCEDMKREAERVCEQHPDRYDCPDCLINYSAPLREYGIIIHDGGTGSSRIRFCPWCGYQLAGSLRDLWFDELEAKGIDPWKDDVPNSYQTDEWYRDRPI